MKKIDFIQYLLFSIAILLNAGCKKDITEPTPVQADNTAPIVDAGPDIVLEIPVAHTILTGAAIDANGDIVNYEWRKITGPESYYIERPTNNLSPKLLWLEEGEYEFEFTATDKNSLFDKDTVKVTVFSHLRKHVLPNLTPNASGFSEAQLPADVFENIKWVDGKSGGRCEQANEGSDPGMDYYLGGGYYYELLPGNIISVFGGWAGFNVDVIIYY